MAAELRRLSLRCNLSWQCQRTLGPCALHSYTYSRLQCLQILRVDCRPQACPCSNGNVISGVPKNNSSMVGAAVSLYASPPCRSGSGTSSDYHPIRWVEWSRCTSGCLGTELSNSTTSPPSECSDQDTLDIPMVEVNTVLYMLLCEACPVRP